MIVLAQGVASQLRVGSEYTTLVSRKSLATTIVSWFKPGLT
jgi:hypothetical protein